MVEDDDYDDREKEKKIISFMINYPQIREALHLTSHENKITESTTKKISPGHFNRNRKTKPKPN